MFDGFGTSKALDNPYFYDMLRLFAKQQGHRSAVLFNNGLHGWHLDDENEYPLYYRKMLEFLLSEFPGLPVVAVLTTAVADKDQQKRAERRNLFVKQIAADYNCPVIDLFTPSKENAAFLSSDGVHFTEEGYRILARSIINTVYDIIKFRKNEI